MARRQTPLEGTGAVVRFAERLRATREEAGLTLRQLAKRSGFSPTTLSIAEGGKKMPSWDVTAAFVAGCGVTDTERWRGLWESAQDGEARPARPDTGDNSGPEPPKWEPESPEPTVLVRTRWWPLIVAVLCSSVLTATVTVLLVPNDAAPNHASLASSYPPGNDPVPTEACGGEVIGYGCQGKEPNETPCWGEGAQRGKITAIVNEGQSVGSLENWYSPRCGTNWATLHIPAGWQGRIEIVAQTDKACFPTDCQALYGKTPPFWTTMVFGMNNPVSARGYVQFPNGEIKEFRAETT
ncbi:helix-turn-helix domain-containing protein [Kitasatospora sp. NPDC059673]|uniref:helix-turn-helix domain-containing protein n=1 Tax=Kitasatospora sp. NPDC059673 TaxID=3346901 RepID=UPI003678DDE5